MTVFTAMYLRELELLEPETRLCQEGTGKREGSTEFTIIRTHKVVPLSKELSSYNVYSSHT